jgi:hypothetical protein
MRALRFLRLCLRNVELGLGGIRSATGRFLNRFLVFQITATIQQGASPPSGQNNRRPKAEKAAEKDHQDKNALAGLSAESARFELSPGGDHRNDDGHQREYKNES